MQLSSRYLKRFAFLLGAWFCALLSGCGTADYEQLASRRVEEFRGSAPFKTLFGPTELADTPIRIRVPMIFKNSYMENSAHPDDGARISPDRLQPPFLPLPGFKVCYESMFGVAGKPVPYYCYLAAVPAKPGDADKLADQLMAALKEKFKETPDTWELVDAATPTTKSLPWKKIRVTADQSFRSFDGQKVSPGTLPGIFELWLHDAPGYIVLVGWRVAVGAEGAEAWVDPTRPNAPASEPKLDLAKMPALTAGSLTIESAAPAEGAAQ